MLKSKPLSQPYPDQGSQLGIHSPGHREQALALGESLGLYRDYPVSKGCTSPFAPIWIQERIKRQE